MENTDWSIKEFNAISKRQLSSDKVEKLKLPTVSIPWKYRICRYHIEEYERIMKESITDGPGDDIVQAVGKILKQAAGTDEGHDFMIAQFTAEAHVIAFAQTLHSTADILANILSISLDIKPTKQRNITLHNVKEEMKTQKIAPIVYKQVEKFYDSDEFLYLAAYVNTVKHKSLVKANYSVKLNLGEEYHGLKIKSFSRNSRKWNSKWTDEFVDKDFKEISNMFGSIGCALNNYLDNAEI